MFDEKFVWGVASAAMQIEGAAYDDGKNADIWNIFCAEQGRIEDGSNIDVACDYYKRFSEDIKLIAEMGVKAYRFSVNWSRIMPNGTGKVNQKGLDFYSRVLDELQKYDIEPYLTVYHWDLPYELHKRGGWQNPEISDYFAEYAAIISQNYSDRIKNMITLNEPQVFVGCGYKQGEHAPGLKLGDRELLNIGHNVLMAHGKAVSALRANSSQKLNIGFVNATSPAIPETESREDVEAAKKAYKWVGRGNFIFTDGYWLDPIVFGKYSDNLLAEAADIMPRYTDEDMKIISAPIDFIGENIYRGNVFKADENGNPIPVRAKFGRARTAIGWDITPDALYWGAVEEYERYKLPYLITENGMSCHDWVSLDGKVHDPNRIDYMRRYLAGYRRAADEGVVPLLGYFAWSLTDNFEWAKGYDERFGLIYVDFETQKRTLKDSAYWYGEMIKSNGKIL